MNDNKHPLIQRIEELGLSVIANYSDDGDSGSCEFKCVDSQGQAVAYARGWSGLEAWFESQGL